MLLAQDFPYGDDFVENPSSDPTELLKNTVIGDQGNDSFIEQVLKVF